MRVLVTGGAGYIGAASVAALLETGHEVVVLDNLGQGHREAVDPAARFIEGSYGDAAVIRRLVEREGIEAVLHCAALSLVGESVRDPARYYRENVAGGFELLEGLRAAGVQRFVLSSTAAVYGLPIETPITEEAALQPINPYGETKRTLEGMLAWYGTAYGFRSIALRYFNAAGATNRVGEVHDPETHLVPNVLAAAEGQRALTVFGDDYPTPDGTCVRDYVHVLDLADAHVLALGATAPDDRRSGAPGAGSFLACNLGNGGGFSVRAVIAAAERVTGRPIPYSIGPRRPGDPPVLVASAERARIVLGWAPRHAEIDEIVGSAWAWRSTHPDGYVSPA